MVLLGVCVLRFCRVSPLRSPSLPPSLTSWAQLLGPQACIAVGGPSSLRDVAVSASLGSVLPSGCWAVSAVSGDPLLPSPGAASLSLQVEPPSWAPVSDHRLAGPLSPRSSRSRSPWRGWRTRPVHGGYGCWSWVRLCPVYFSVLSKVPEYWKHVWVGSLKVTSTKIEAA